MHTLDNDLYVLDTLMQKGISCEAFDTREQWMDYRIHATHRIHASEAATLYGAHRYQSAYSLAQMKLGLEIPASDPKSAAKGHKWERFIAEQAVDELNETATDGRIYELLALPREVVFTNERYPSLSATPDGVVTCRSANGAFLWMGPVECKKVRWSKAQEWADGPPLDYQVQHHVQMACMGAPRGVVAAIIGDELTVSIEEYSSARGNAIHAAASTFLHDLSAGHLPNVDGLEATTKALGLVYRRATEEQVLLPMETADWIEQIDKANEMLDEWEERKREAENNLRSCLGTSSYGVYAGGMVSWKAQGGKPTKLTLALESAEALRLLGVKFETVSSPVCRVLRIKKKGPTK